MFNAASTSSLGFYTVGGSTQVGGILGAWDTPNVSMSNVKWLSNAAAASCVGWAGSTTNCTSTADADDFFSALLAPLSSWDFVNVWLESGSSFPTLREP